MTQHLVDKKKVRHPLSHESFVFFRISWVNRVIAAHRNDIEVYSTLNKDIGFLYSSILKIDKWSWHRISRYQRKWFILCILFWPGKSSFFFCDHLVKTNLGRGSFYRQIGIGNFRSLVMFTLWHSQYLSRQR